VLNLQNIERAIIEIVKEIVERLFGFEYYLTYRKKKVIDMGSVKIRNFLGPNWKL